jgi:hypothetical protein
MDRLELAKRCARIDAAGGSVRDYLHELGFISPWGTWHRLQKEELGRKDYEITEGKGSEEMRKITLEQRKKAVDIALNGESPLKYLEGCGAKNPSASWVYIKKILRETKPEIYAQLMALKEQPDEDTIPTADGLPFEKAAEISAEMGAVEAAKRAEKTAGSAVNYAEVIAVEEKINADELTYQVTGLRTSCGEYSINGKEIFFTIPDDQEIGLPIELWKRIAKELPGVLKVLGA